MTGNRLAHYQILEKLGEGGMGAVYRAEDTKLERIVAVKVIGEGMAGDATARARLIREAKTASALNHPNICTIYEVGEAEGQTYIAMEYVEGRPLSAMAAEGLPADAVVRYGVQIADALAHAHEKGVVHRDLKSANVMVTPLGRVKVLDFGLAKRMESGSEATVTQAGTIAGTLAYMAPEVLRGEPADGRSDLWALGVMLYEAAERKLPFQGRSAFEVTSLILREPPPPLGEKVPLGLRGVIQHCLAKEPGERYQRAGEVKAALEAVESMRFPLPVPGTRAVSRRRWMWWAAGGLAAAGGVGAWLRRRGPPGPRLSKNAEANEYYQRAIVSMGHGMDLPRGRQMLERALELDPRFAEARAWHGFTSLLMVDTGASNDSGWIYKAEEEIRAALAEDPQCGRAHSALAAVYYYQGRKEQLAQEARRAIELDPTDVDGPIWMGNYHELNGEYAQAEAIMRKLLDRDPLFIAARMNLGEYLRQQGKVAEAIREQEKILEQDPQNFYALGFLAQAYLTVGDAAKARQALERVGAENRKNYRVRLAWALVDAAEGKAEAARRELDAEVLKASQYGSVVLMVAECYALLGDKAQALDWLERAVRAGDDRAAWFEQDPLLAAVRGESRFRQIVESIRNRKR